MFKQEKEKASISSVSLELKPFYPDKMDAKQFQKFDGRKARQGSMWFSFDSIGLFAINAELYFWEWISAELAYTWYVNLNSQARIYPWLGTYGV